MVGKNSPIFLVTRPTGIIAVLFCVIIFSFLIIPVSADVIENGDFYYGYSGWTSSGTVTSGEDTHSATWYELNANTHDGYVCFNVGSGGKTEHTVTHQLIQNINVTDIDTIYIRGRGTGISGAGRTFTLYVGSLSYGLSANSSWDVYALNVSSLSGVQEIKIKLYLYSDYDRYGASYDIDWVRTNVYYEYIDTDAVSWDKDPYYTGETATIETRCYDFDDTTYSYYLDLYNTNDYLTTYEITDEVQSFDYVFPLDWVDTSLLAKLVRVTDPYAADEIQLAYDISHFETLDLDTTVSFNKSSYNPSEALKVTWSGAANGSSVWLRAGNDGEVIESNVAYSGSFTFNVPANTTETYYIVDVITGGYSQVQASCGISSVPDFFFNYSVDVDQDEYYHGDWVTVTYSTDSPAVIKVFDDTNADIWHYLDVPAAVTNETWIYYIGDTDPFGSYSVLFGNNDFLVSDYYSVVSSTSFVQVVPESMYMYETMTIWYVTNGSSTLSITDWWDSILFNQTVNSSSLESISYVPTASGELTITLSDVPVDATDSIIVYWAADPDDVPDDDVPDDDDVVEDVLEDDESMTDYFEGKFREFAPTAWGIFLLSVILWLMAILVSFGGSGKRR
jgi:hypothetical protein